MVSFAPEMENPAFLCKARLEFDTGFQKIAETYHRNTGLKSRAPTDFPSPGSAPCLWQRYVVQPVLLIPLFTF